MIRILIADAHAVVREGLRCHLAANPNWQVVAEAADGREAMLKVAATVPDVAVLAYGLPLANGIDLTRKIRAQFPSTEVIIFTFHNMEALMRPILEAGARGCVLKSEPMAHLVKAIESVAKHKPYFTSPRRSAPNEPGSPLTNREREVIQLVAEGHTNKTTARLLGITPKTVETHRSSVMQKLDLRGTVDIVRYAVRHQIVQA